MPEASWPAYALTTVRQPVNRMVETTTRVLLDKIGNPDAEPERTEIPGRLIVRESARRLDGQAA